MIKHLTFLGLLLLTAAGATQSAAQQNAHLTRGTTAATFTASQRCADVPVVVTAASPDDGDLVCSAAQQALQLLGRCGISLRRPLPVNILSDLRHPFDRPVLGFFDIALEMVLIRPRKVIVALVKDTPFGVLPLRELYASIVVHEIIHGALHQNSVRHVMSYTAGEYLAYALQIESLAPGVRDQFLQSVAKRLTMKNFVFSDVLLSLDPFLFAAHAYEHLKASQNPCSYLTALMEGEVAFISAQPYWDPPSIASNRASKLAARDRGRATSEWHISSSESLCMSDLAWKRTRGAGNFPEREPYANDRRVQAGWAAELRPVVVVIL